MHDAYIARRKMRPRQGPTVEFLSIRSSAFFTSYGLVRQVVQLLVVAPSPAAVKLGGVLNTHLHRQCTWHAFIFYVGVGIITHHLPPTFYREYPTQSPALYANLSLTLTDSLENADCRVQPGHEGAHPLSEHPYAGVIDLL